jgi:hypothetical protein
MTIEQEAHLKEIQDRIALRINSKYRRGQAEHGGNLWDRPAFPDMADEVTDFNTYFVTLERQLHQMHEAVQKIKEHVSQMKWAEAMDLLDRLDSAFRSQLPPEKK